MEKVTLPTAYLAVKRNTPRRGKTGSARSDRYAFAPTAIRRFCFMKAIVFL